MSTPPTGATRLRPALPAHPERGPSRTGARGGPSSRSPRSAATLASQLWSTVAIATILCLVTFIATGGISQGEPGPATSVEMGLTIGAGLAIAARLIWGPPVGRLYGLWPLVGLLALTVLSAVSVVWSVEPNSSWEDAGRLLAYSAVFGAAVLLARAAPGRWPSLLGGIALAAIVICVYALLTKVFPAQLDASDPYARLRAPYGYWNATGLTAAMGAICCLWLGTRRHGHRLLTALAYPGLGITLVTLLLAYSRGALAALVLGVLLWLCIVPLRLRSAAVLIPSVVCAGLVVLYDFSNHALSTSGAQLAQRTAAGHRLGVLLIAMVLVLSAAGVGIGFGFARRPLRAGQRRFAGWLLIYGAVLLLVAFATALAASQRGLTGTVSHTLSSLVNPNAPLPPDDAPGRLTAASSVRARYWKEGLEVFAAHPIFGTGARTYGTSHLRYRGEALEVRDAHGYLVQTLADLGLVGLLVTLGLLGAWLCAAGRSTHPFNRRWQRWRWRRLAPGSLAYTPERIGMLALLCVAVVFGIHSFADWTWFIPGDACVALIAAGWLAGRGPLASSARGSRTEAARPESSLRVPGTGVSLPAARSAIALAVLAGALLASWVQWQPARSVESDEAATVLAPRHPVQAIALAQTAVTRDPLSLQARETLASVQQAAGENGAARATLSEAVRLQPANPQAWFALGQFDLVRDPRAALEDLRAVIYLNPESISAEALASGDVEAIAIHNDYVEALRASAQAGHP